MLLRATFRNAAFRSRRATLQTRLAVATPQRCFSTARVCLSGQSGSSVHGSSDGASAGSPAMPQGFRKESRFTRSNTASAQETPGKTGRGSHAPHYGSGSGSREAGFTVTSRDDAAPQLSVETLLDNLTYTREAQSHRGLTLYLQRVQGVLRRSRHPAVATTARAELQKVFLPGVKGIDGSTVTLLLQTLRVADVAKDAALLQDAVAWLSLYGYHLPFGQYIRVVELLDYFHVPLAEEWVRTLPQRLALRDVPALSAEHAVTLLAALLPCLRFPTPTLTTATQTDSASGGAATSRKSAVEVDDGTAADRALLELAEQLRERCSNSELVSCDPPLVVQLLQSLILFRVSREWQLVPDKEAWSSLQEAVCAAAAAPAFVRGLDVTKTVELLDLLVRVRASQAEEEAVCADGASAEAGASAAKQLESALAAKLEAALKVLASAGAETSAELPAPWRLQDVRTLWRASVLHTSRKGRDAPQQGANAVDNVVWTRSRDVLLAFISQWFSTHESDLGMAEMAFAVARSCAASSRAGAQHVCGALPETSGEATSAPAETDSSLVTLTDCLPSTFVRSLVDSTSEQLRASTVTWTSLIVQDAVALFERSADAAHRALALQLAQRWYKELQSRAQEGTRVLPDDLLAFFHAELLRKERVGVDAAVTASLRRWSVSEVLYFFSRLSTAAIVNTAAAAAAAAAASSAPATIGADGVQSSAGTVGSSSTSNGGGGGGGGLEVAAVLRQAGTALCTYASKASAAQLATLVECYGAAHVRNDDFCEAAARRLGELLDVSLASSTRHVGFSSISANRDASAEGYDEGSEGAARSSAVGGDDRVSGGNGQEGSGSLSSASPVTLPQLTQILRSFALMEVRQTRPFIDAAPHVTLAAAEDQGSAQDITQLLAAYAKMLIWNYPVFRALAERLCRIRREDVRLTELVTAQLALLRMDVALPAVTERFYEALTEQYGAASRHKTAQQTGLHVLRGESLQPTPRAALSDAVMQLSVLSRLRGRSHVEAPAESVIAGLVEFIVQRAELLRVAELAEVLLSLARLDEGHSTAFATLTVRTLGLLPTAPPRVMAHIAEAYALANRGDDAELFTLIAERTIAMRHEMAAVTIASILAAFARAGVRHDRLFIEVIPRVRHVGTYGTPRDVVNVVSAYAAVNLWHYKLFAKLADRAVQLRSDFRVTELVRLLQSYAAVQMRYDVLFTEFAPRIQTLAHLLTPSDLAGVVSSYNQLNIPCVPVWKATASRAVVVADAFTEAEAEQLLDAYSTQGYYDAECVKTLTARFPALASIPFETKEAELSDNKAVDQEQHEAAKS